MSNDEDKRPDPTSREFRLNNFQENMVVVSYKSWIVIVSFAALMVGIIIWAIFGSISVMVAARGIALTTEGVLEITAGVDGQINELYVHPGDIVTKDYQIAKIYSLQHEVEIKNAKEKLAILKKDYLDAKEVNENELDRKVASIQRDSKAVKFEIEERENGIPHLEKDLKSKEKLYQEGLISALLVRQAEDALMEEKIAIENLRAKLKKNEVEIQQSYKSDELKNYKRIYYDALNKFSELEVKSSYFQILSTYPGRILEVQVKVGESVKEGQTIALIEKTPDESTEYLFYFYASSSDGSKVKIGSTAYIELLSVDPQKYGYLVGEVSSVSSYPVTDSRIYSIVNSDDVVEFLTNSNDAVIEIVVHPIKQSGTPSGYQWTSGKGPNMQVHTGLVGIVKLQVETRRPISYLFPDWWIPQVSENEKE